jgi:hypothetical protein
MRCIVGYNFCALKIMDKHTANEGASSKLQVRIGDKIAYVEIISLREQIYSVEFAGSAPIFITRVKDKNQQVCWISIPQGNNELAGSVGRAIENREAPET